MIHWGKYLSPGSNIVSHLPRRIAPVPTVVTTHTQVTLVVIVLTQITCKRSSTLLFLTRTHTHNRHTVYMYRCISRLPRFLLDRIVLQIMMSHRQPSVDDLSLELMTLVLPGGPFSTNCTDVVIPPEVLYIGVKFRR